MKTKNKNQVKSPDPENQGSDNVPRLRFPEFKNMWKFSELGKHLSVNTGNKDTQDRKVDGVYPFFVRSDKVECIDSYQYDGEAILTSGDGVGVGRNYHYIIGKFNYHQRVYCLYNFSKDVSGKYIFHFFSKAFYKRVKRLSAKNSVDSVRMDMIVKMPIIIPSLPEQKKIAAFLSAVDKKIQHLTRKKELLEQYKKGVMQKIFSQEIRFKDEKGREFPDWEEKRGNKVFINHSNKNHDSGLPILAASQEKGMVSRKSIGYEIKTSKESIKSYKVVEPGDFVISLRSFQGGIEYSDVLGICSPAYIILKPKINISNKYFKHYFKKEDFITRLSKIVVGIRDGKQITYNAFSGLKLPVPSLPEQEKIASFLSSIDKKIDSIDKQLSQTKEFKKGLLQQMFV